jgi:hypothetical protein
MTCALRDRQNSTALADDGRADLQDFAAELTEAAYPIALQHKPGERWLDLQLELWRAMQKTLQRWQQRPVQPHARRALA